jgi:hypothetical protein
MSDPPDFRRSTGMRLREDSPVPYDDFYCAPRGTYGHPNVDPGPRTASPDLIERAMAAYQFTRPDTRFANLVSRFPRMLEW